MDYMVASESCALKQLGFMNFVDILPGQAVIFRKGVDPVAYQIEERKAYSPDIFEFCYFARPDSIIDGISVNESRENMGYRLAEKIRQVLTQEEIQEIDAIIPIPETSNVSAPRVAGRLKRKFVQGFVKNRYPGQQARQRGVKRKLNAMDEKFAGQNVLLIDDSIVRGTTSKEIVSMARDAGAKKVYFASAAPPVTHAHIYGIDLASPNELVAHDHDNGKNRAHDEIAKHIGADRIFFQDLEDLKAACSDAYVSKSTPREGRDFEVGVFCGNYTTPVDEEYFGHLEKVRGQARKQEEAREGVAIGSADARTVEIAAQRVQMVANGECVPAASDVAKCGAYTNGNGEQKRRKQTREEGTPPKDQMDISLHNIGDFP
ncbi:MAG: hypothetical protein Q9207_007115 [Kuettlingeria erythrocarpa]